MADLRRLPPGTLPPVVLKYDGGLNLPVCLITLKGQGLNETQLKDLAQFSVRNQTGQRPELPCRIPMAAPTGRSRFMSIR